MVMEAAWELHLEKLLNEPAVTVRQEGDRPENHRTSLNRIKEAIKRILKLSLNPSPGKQAEIVHVERMLLLIQRTLQGQTCAFGAQIFDIRWACIILLNLIKVFPEPHFRPVSEVLVETTAQLVEQFGRQDLSLLQTFIKDCISAINTARGGSLNAFPNFVQRCKDQSKAEEGSGSPRAKVARSEPPPGLQLNLDPSRISPLCTRLVALASRVTCSLRPFIAPRETQGVQLGVVGLASDVVNWRLQTSEASAAPDVMSACIRGLFELQNPSHSHLSCTFRNSLASLEVQARILDVLPSLCNSAVCKEQSDLWALLQDFLCFVIRTYDDVIVFPQLEALLQPWWPPSSSTHRPLQVLQATAQRFGCLHISVMEIWQIISTPSLSNGWLQGDLPSPLYQPQFHADLASVLCSLGAYEVLCSTALTSCSQPPSDPVIVTKDAPKDHSMLLLALAVRAVSPDVTIEQNSSCYQARSLLVEHIKWALNQTASEPQQWFASVRQILLEILVELPHVLSSSDIFKTVDAFVTRELNVLGNDPKPSSWHALLIAQRVLVTQTTESLLEKFRALRRFVTSLPTGQKRPVCVELVGWVAMGQLLSFHIDHRLKGLNNSEGSNASVEQETQVYKHLTHSLVDMFRGNSAPPNQAVLIAVAYLLPLLTTLSFLCPDLHECGPQEQQPQFHRLFQVSPAMPSCSFESALNAVRVKPAFNSVPSPVRSNHSGCKSGSRGNPMAIPAACPKCSTAFRVRGSLNPPSQQPAERKRSGNLFCQPCRSCGFELPCFDWSIFSPEANLQFPMVWGQLRKLGAGANSIEHNTCRWIRTARELVEIFAKLCTAIWDIFHESKASSNPLHLLEPLETQMATNQSQLAEEQPGLQSENYQNDAWFLLSFGLCSLCVSANCVQIHDHAHKIAPLMQRLMPFLESRSTPECHICTTMLLALLESDSFAVAINGLRKRTQSAGDTNFMSNTSPSVAVQGQCHKWRLETIGGSAASEIWRSSLPQDPCMQTASTLAEDAFLCVRPAEELGTVQPLILRALCAGAPKSVLLSVLSSLAAGLGRSSTRRVMREHSSAVSNSSVTSNRSAHRSGSSRNMCLQQLCLLSMLHPISVDDLFISSQGGMHARLFEDYSRADLRVPNCCKLFFRGPLKLHMKSWLPKLLPALVLTKNNLAMQDLSVLLGESIQSLFTPQLPFVLCAIVQQPLQKLVDAFGFILDSVYNNQMTMTSICDASLGKLLVSILWRSVGAETGTITQNAAREQAIAAIENVVAALGKKENVPACSGHKRKTHEAGLADRSGVAAAAPALRSIHIPTDSHMEVSEELMQTVEDSFLHVLDILEIVLKGDQKSPKWAEYSPLLEAAVGRDGLDYRRFFAAVALLFEIANRILHKFASKVLEFLQSATATSGYHSSSVRCWRLFVQFVGIQRLKPFISAVVGEVKGLAEQLRFQTPDVTKLLSEVLEGTCKHHPDLVASLPKLPSDWPELQVACSAVERSLGGKKASEKTFTEKLRAAVAQLEEASQHSSRVAVLQLLLDLVTSQRQTFHLEVCEQDTQLLGRLLRTLLNFLRKASKDDQLQVGTLLGQIGAIDPSRVKQDEPSRRGVSSLHIQMPDLRGQETLARHVVEDYLLPMASRVPQCAFAVQEILKWLESSGKKEGFIKSLKDSDKETLRPYLTSSYRSMGAEQGLTNTASLDGLISWAVKLVKSGDRALFESCIPAARVNHTLGLFLAPRLIMQMLYTCDRNNLIELCNLLGNLLDSGDHLAAQAVFSLMDELERYVFAIKREHGGKRGANTREAFERQKQVAKVDQLLSSIPRRKVFHAARQSGASARALQYLELAIIDEKGGYGKYNFGNPNLESAEDCLCLESVYRSLDDPDAAMGALLIGPTNIQTWTLQTEHLGYWSDLQTCYEERLRVCKSDASEGSTVAQDTSEQRADLLCGLVRCLQNQGHFESSLCLVRGENDTATRAKLQPAAVNAAWRLSKWDHLEQVLAEQSAVDVGIGKQPKLEEETFSVQLGRALHAFHERNEQAFNAELTSTRLGVTHALASAARESYTRAYPLLLKLHVLADLEWLHVQQNSDHASRACEVSLKTDARGSLAKQLLQRAELTAPAYNMRDILLSPLRVALEDLQQHEDAKHLELKLFKIARKEGKAITMARPSACNIKISQALLVKEHVEWSRQLYTRGRSHDAFQHLQTSKVGSNVVADQDAKARLLATRWATEASLYIPKIAENEFRQLVQQDNLNNMYNEESAHFHYGAYLDTLLKEHVLGQASAAGPALNRQQSNSDFASKASVVNKENLIAKTLISYLNALRRGSKRLHYTLNRVLQLAWDCCEVDNHKHVKVVTQVAIEPFIDKLECWMWYSVLPQIISRVHNTYLRELFKKIIYKMLIKYPTQATWYVIPLTLSADSNTQKLGNDLFLQTARQNDTCRAVSQQHKGFSVALAELARWMPADGVWTVNLKANANLQRVLRGFSDTQRILIPLQSQLSANVPLDWRYVRGAREVNPFPGGAHGLVTVHSVIEEVEVLKSKAKPKKIQFRGSDGLIYPFLCKVEKRSDLRKDSRIMEFASMVNQLLQKDSKARQWNLQVCTYSVIPLTENIGLIEWVPDTRAIRYLISDMWQQMLSSDQPSPVKMKELLDTSRHLGKDRHAVFLKEILPKHPPVLQYWFLHSTDPSTWLAKRRSFCHSQALWCMLGYIVGLGDRHGENILVDMRSGRLVHVDFECLFGAGLKLETPEKVPFRLTQNCVAALGVTGIEGSFRLTCELCLGILRERTNLQTCLSVLHSFLADPLMEWRVKSGQDIAREKIREIEMKLSGSLNVGAQTIIKKQNDKDRAVLNDDDKGCLGRDRGAGLSVAGQVDELLKAAMCPRNLSEMYVGWLPWL